MCYSQPNDDIYYMQQALSEAKKAVLKGEVPVGAVIVKDGEIIASACNMRENWQDATAHAEIIAIRQACARLKSWRLAGCTLYVTLEPCPMCAGAIIMSRLERLVYASPDSRAGAVESIFNVVANAALNHQVKVLAGVCEEECRDIMRAFFQGKRK